MFGYPEGMPTLATSHRGTVGHFEPGRLAGVTDPSVPTGLVCGLTVKLSAGSVQRVSYTAAMPVVA